MLTMLFAGLAPSQTFDEASLLPMGAKVAQSSEGVRETSWAKKPVKTKDAIFVDPWGESGTQQVVVFYSLGQDSVVRLYERNPKTHRLAVRWENSDQGATFDPMSGIWDINGDGKKEIVAFRWIGASVGGTLNIFAWDGRSLKQVSPDWNVDINRAQVLDLKGDGQPEIILGHRFDLPSIYEWRDGSYNDPGQQFPTYYEKETNEYARLAQAADEHFTGADLASFCESAVHGYIYQRKYAEAIRLAQVVLKNPKVQEARFSVAALYVALGDCYRADEKYPEAKGCYEKAFAMSQDQRAKKRLEELNQPPKR
ncbi:MAG: hypothetical protein ACHQKY_15280 [Terriglobia bacterium]